jgi:DNA-binding transcriptional MerR regulator
MRKKVSAAQIRENYSAVEAAKIAAVPYQTLDYWARTEFIQPSAAGANGRGSERKYTFDDLIALRVARELRTAGASPQALRTVITALRAEHRSLAESRFMVVGSDIVMATNCGQVMSVLKKPGQLAFAAFIVDGPKTVIVLEKEIRKLRAA